MIRKYLDNANLYQRVIIFALIMAFLWWVVELLTFHSISYIIESPSVLYNTFAKRQAVWIMTGCLIGIYIFKD
jgi:hypothetical protein